MVEASMIKTRERRDVWQYRPTRVKKRSEGTIAEKECETRDDLASERPKPDEYCLFTPRCPRAIFCHGNLQSKKFILFFPLELKFVIRDEVKYLRPSPFIALNIREYNIYYIILTGHDRSVPRCKHFTNLAYGIIQYIYF